MILEIEPQASIELHPHLVLVGQHGLQGRDFERKCADLSSHGWFVPGHIVFETVTK